jgi:hypothetical protein
MALRVQRFSDDGYGLVVVIDTDTLNLEGIRAQYDRARAAAGASNDPYFETVGRVPDHVEFWAYDPDTIPTSAPALDEDDVLAQLTDAPWDEWQVCEAQPEVLREIERLAGFRWGSAKLEVDPFDVYLRITHKHAEGGLGVFTVCLDPRQWAGR